MSRPLSKKTVELQAEARPSRIRRDPVRVEERKDVVSNAWWRNDELEVPIAIVGMIVFALGINAMWFVLTELFG